MKWSSVRVSVATKARLEALRGKMTEAESSTLYPRFEPDSRDRVGFEQVIVALLDERDRHAARKRKSAATRRRKDIRLGIPVRPEEPRVVPPGPGPASASAD